MDGSQASAREQARKNRELAARLCDEAIRDGRHSATAWIVCEACGHPMDGAWKRTLEGKLICRTCAKE